ncbi:MAG: hypothetical protein J7J44_05750 [Deltaproteobacteria bacterium]|nr:hypothetical protein [Deltaproteobacteria bacterium]
MILPVYEWRTVASRIPEMRKGKFKIVKRPIKAGSMLDMHGVFGYDRCLFLKDSVITVLYEGDLDPARDPKGVWMSDSPFEYYSMWEFVARTKPSRVLIGGLGLGILANLLALRSDIESIKVIEISKEVIEMISPYLNPKVHVIQGDFLRVIRDLRMEGEEFDTVIVDIFKSGDDVELYEDCKLAVFDAYPDAELLFWAFQKEFENEQVSYWLAVREVQQR